MRTHTRTSAGTYAHRLCALTHTTLCARVARGLIRTRALGRTRIVFEGIVYRLIQIGRAATDADDDGEWLRLRGTADRLRRRLGLTLERCWNGVRAARVRGEPAVASCRGGRYPGTASILYPGALCEPRFRLLPTLNFTINFRYHGK